MATFTILFLCNNFCLWVAAAPPRTEQWLAVVAPAYREAMKPLVAHRRAQGMKVAVLDPAPPEVLRKRLADACAAHPGRSSILLVGAVESLFADRVVAAHVGSVSRMDGQPSDAPYGCLGDTRLPRVAVGRFPARDEEECRAMVRKTLALEQAKPGPWQHRLTVLAGIPAFHPAVDRLVETLAFARLDQLAPTWKGQALYTGHGSPFRVPQGELRSTARRLLSQPQLLTLYLGHSDAQGLYAGKGQEWLERSDFARLKMPIPGLFFTFGCLGCQLSGPTGEGYGLSAVRNPEGPAAVLGSHGICFAAMVQLATEQLFEQAFADQLPPRLGDCWLACLQGVARGKINPITYRLLDAVDGDPRIDQATQRQEHLEMFVLLGDPALRLPRATARLDWEVADRVRPGQTVRVTGTLPPQLAGAEVEIELARTPASAPLGLQPVPKADGAAILRANFARANQFRLVHQSTTAVAGSFALDLQLPQTLPWPEVIVRLRATSPRDTVEVARRIKVQQPTDEEP
jgi:hypothetical protein